MEKEEKPRAEKTAVIGLLDRDAREVRAKVIPNVNRETLQNEILVHIERKATIYTDGWKGYSDLERQEFIHEMVNHIEEYVRGDVHINGLENFWALMKRSLKGTYVAVEPFHLDHYVTEQVFRYNNRNACALQSGCIADLGEATDVQGTDWQGSSEAILNVKSAGSES